jgi:hypothetical protein
MKLTHRDQFVYRLPVICIYKMQAFMYRSSTFDVIANVTGFACIGIGCTITLLLFPKVVLVIVRLTMSILSSLMSVFTENIEPKLLLSALH